MKFNRLSLGLLSFSTLFPLAPFLTSQANAACITVDAATQVALHGSRNPAVQSNDVEMHSDENCFGNVTTDTGTQVSHSSGEVEQSRSSSHFVGGGTEDNYGLSGPVVGVQAQTQLDVYNPAYDPEVVDSYKGFVDPIDLEDSQLY